MFYFNNKTITICVFYQYKISVIYNIINCYFIVERIDPNEKKAIRFISGIIVFTIFAVSIFVPVTVNAASYTAPANAKFITDVTVGRILAGITPGTTVSDLEAMFSGYTLSVKNTSNVVITADAKISTGCKVTVLSSGSTVDTFTTIIYGDVNNDGIIDSTDSVTIIQAITGNTVLDRINFLAADITNDKKNNATDLLNMSLHLLDVNTISQTASSEVKTLGKKLELLPSVTQSPTVSVL